MEKNKYSPTMFIDTISSDITSNNSLSFFDSRIKNQSKTWKVVKEPTIIDKKLQGLLNLVNKNIEINVYIELESTYIEGYLKSKKDNFIIIEQDSKIKEIDQNTIKDIIVLDTK